MENIFFRRPLKMDAGVVTIIAALIAALPPTLTAILSSKKNRDSIKDVAQKVDRTEEELKRQGELLAKTERAFRERKKHEELQSKLITFWQFPRYYIHF